MTTGTKKCEDGAKADRKFEEGTDYYFDAGLMVLTARFLEKRGFCCGNGCRHCPYPESQRPAQSK